MPGGPSRGPLGHNNLGAGRDHGGLSSKVTTPVAENRAEQTPSVAPLAC